MSSQNRVYLSFRNFHPVRTEFCEWLRNYDVSHFEDYVPFGDNAEVVSSIVDDFLSDEVLEMIANPNTGTYGSNMQVDDPDGVAFLLHKFALEVTNAFPDIYFDCVVEKNVPELNLTIESYFQKDPHHAEPFENIQMNITDKDSTGSMRPYMTLVEQIRAFANLPF